MPTMTEDGSTSDTIELDEDERDPDEPALPAGTTIDGKYVILKTLGSGGTGKVYEAEHTVIGHHVALKIVSTERAERPETLARFQREARICGAVRHPNVGRIFDVGMHAGRPYMVLELHEGQSLADVLDESILPLPAIIEISLQVLSALGAVHEAGVVHRDVKPDNTMLTRTLNGDILVKLVDFGISKMITTDIRQRTLTREGSILGSPDYMAPEQLRGQEVDSRTDLYAVGVLLYEAVTGATPFNASNLSDLMAAILRDQIVPPRELRPECPPELDTLIAKALSREPSSRFQSAADMARALEQVRGALRYSPDPGIAGLRKPMPRREDRATRDRRAARKRSAAVASEPTMTEETFSVDLPGRRRYRTPILAAFAAALLTLIVRVALTHREATPSQAASAADEPNVSTVRANAPKVLTAAVAPAAVPDAGAALETTQPNTTVPAAKPKRPAPARTAAESAPKVDDLLKEASSAFVMGQMPRAKALYQQVLARSPNEPDAWRGLGLVSSRMGQSNDARQAFDRYLKLRPNAPDADRIRQQREKLTERALPAQ
jgi:serine/threonine-protein kinase